MSKLFNTFIVIMLAAFAELSVMIYSAFGSIGIGYMIMNTNQSVFETPMGQLGESFCRMLLFGSVGYMNLLIWGCCVLFIISIWQDEIETLLHRWEKSRLRK